MAEVSSSDQTGGFLASLRTARSTAVAGLVFSFALVAVIILFRSAFPLNALIDETSTPSPNAINQAKWALILLPYVGIAFIWFMAALNYNLGHADHRLFTTVFLASGIIFVALCFVAGAVASAELEALVTEGNIAGSSRLIPGATVNALLINYSARMAAVFCLSIATFGRTRQLLPTWLTLLGTLSGLFLLLVPFGVPLIEFVFPVWIAILSVYLIIADPGGKWQQSKALST